MSIYSVIERWSRKHRDVEGLAGPGCTLGCDYSGVVEDVGSNIEKQWKKGDRIAGFAHGGNILQSEDGAFGEFVRPNLVPARYGRCFKADLKLNRYAVVKGDVQYKIPDNTTDEDAATLGVAVSQCTQTLCTRQRYMLTICLQKIITCGQALYMSLELPLPGSGKAGYPILIYGGSTATGSIALQYALHSGCSPIVTTCSPRNFPFVKSLGASEAFDYNNPDCGKKVIHPPRLDQEGSLESGANEQYRSANTPTTI